MTTGPTGTDRRQDAVTSGASDASWCMRQAVTQIAEAGGARVRERSLFPGSISVDRYAEPLAGVRAAGVLADTAARIRREYTERARGEAISWAQIGQALGLGQGPGAKRGHDLGVAAFESFAGEPGLWHHASFGYRCAVCGQHITDRGPYESHPEDRESGHGAGCSRFAAELAAWQAERDAWDAQDQD